MELRKPDRQRRRVFAGEIQLTPIRTRTTNRGAPYFCFRQILESFTGISPAMTQQEARTVIEKIEGDKGERLNIAALAQILPWIGEAARWADAGRALASLPRGGLSRY